MRRYNINWTAKTLVNQMKKGAVNFDNAIQRNLVWDIDKKSLLIHSMVYGYAIPAMYFTKSDGVYDSLDGKQRSNTICEFINDEFALTDTIPDVFDDDDNRDNISGMFFSQLPEWAKDRIRDYNLTIYYYEDMTEDEAREFFRRLNNGKPLSAMELTRVNTPCLKEFQDLAKNTIISDVVSAASKRRFTDEMVAMQIYHIATEENPDFTTKTFREWAKGVTVSQDVISDIKRGLDAYSSFVDSLTDADKKIAKAVKTRTHFISCAYFCYLAVQENISQDAINKTLKDFFSGKPTTSSAYNATISNGSAKPTAVTSRRDVIRSLVASIEEDDVDSDDVENDSAAEYVEEDDFSDINPAEVKAELERRANGESAFVQMVMNDVAKIAAREEAAEEDCEDIPF